MKTSEIARILNGFFPFALQESYDNSGVILDFDNEISKILVSFDINIDVVEDAVKQNANLIISHHPVIFSGLKKLSSKSLSDQVIIKAIEHKISIIAVHTNIDNSFEGVNGFVAGKLQLKNIAILRPMSDQLVKLTTYAPHEYAGVVRDALFVSGAGEIGGYSQCSYNTAGEGTFMASETSNPFVGEKNQIHFEPETKIETIIPEYLLSTAIRNLKKVHPYEEVAYDLYPLKNKNPKTGAGIIGDLEKPMATTDFLKLLKDFFQISVIRHNGLMTSEVTKVAFCGGSGGFLINDAIRQKADIYITGDLKYHDFFDAQKKIILADIGHFESEQHTIDIIIDVLIKKIPNFAILKTNITTNPITYFI
jgi:dinuclear metal center YbgI/SA1388 family protein